MAFNLAHSWQNGPTELIEFAITHLHGESDFEHRMGFFLLDIGVETLFKTYLTLPDKVTGTKMSFSKREIAATGSFPELIQGIAEATQHLTLSTAITHVQFYHDMRNNLYHQGNGIAVPTEKVYTYAQIAVDLLRDLLDVDLASNLKRPELEREARRQSEEQVAQEDRELEGMEWQVQAARQRVVTTARTAMEYYCTPLTLPSFERELDALSYANTGWNAEESFDFPIEDDNITNKQRTQAGGSSFSQTLLEYISKTVSGPYPFLMWMQNTQVLPNDLIELFLLILQNDLAFPEELGEVPSFLWDKIYALTSMYPAVCQEGYYVTDLDSDELEKWVLPTHAEVIQGGQGFVDKLTAVSDLLDKWTASQLHTMKSAIE